MSTSGMVWGGTYNIQRTEAQPFHFEKHPYIFKLSNVLAWVTWICYFIVQAAIIQVISSSSTTVPWHLWAGWFAEICLSCNDFVHGMHLVCQFLRTATVKRRPHYRLLPGPAPTVDVFVPCCGESLDVLTNTIAAAAGQDYPASQFRVVVLDDGRDDKLRNAVDKLNSSGRFDSKIFYRSRKGGSSHFKAGNLFFGLEETAHMNKSDFVGSIDADMIPDPDWLSRMIPHFITDPKLGMLNQPQHYYNIGDGDWLAEGAEFDIWYTLFETANDRVGEAMCQGSGWIVRRSALDQIGSWPLVSTGEDVLCSLKLLFAGWDLGYVREYLQHGTTPNSLQARLKQKTGWAGDILEFIQTFGIYQTTTCLGALAYRDLTSITTTLGLIILPITLLITSWRADPISVSLSQYHWLRTMLLATFFSSKLNDYVTYHRVGLTRLCNYQALNLWCAPYAAMRYLRALPFFRAATPSFFVTGSFVSPINERSAVKRANLIRRLGSSGLPMNITYVLCSSMVVMWSLWRSLTLQTAETSATSNMFHMLILPGPIVKLTACLWKASIPVIYMIAPPPVPEWKDLLESDSQGVLRPNKDAQSIMDSSGSCQDPGNTRFYWDTLEIGVLLASLWHGF